MKLSCCVIGEDTVRTYNFVESDILQILLHFVNNATYHFRQERITSMLTIPSLLVKSIMSVIIFKVWKIQLINDTLVSYTKICKIDVPVLRKTTFPILFTKNVDLLNDHQNVAIQTCSTQTFT